MTALTNKTNMMRSNACYTQSLIVCSVLSVFNADIGKHSSHASILQEKPKFGPSQKPNLFKYQHQNGMIHYAGDLNKYVNFHRNRLDKGASHADV
jgi:hypothetical protein